MIGLGTIINSVSIVAAGLVGQFAGKWFKAEQQESLNRACGVSILFIAIAGAMEGMLRIEDGAINSGKSMLVVLCLAVGTVIGERIGIENGFEAFGEWLKAKTGSSGDAGFVKCLCNGIPDGFHRGDGDHGVHSGWADGKLFHFGGKIRAGLYHCCGDDLLAGAGMPVFGHTGVCV